MEGQPNTLQNFDIPPQEKMTKLGWKIYTNFFKVKQSEKLSMLSQKKKMPNSAKIMGECFAEFLFYGPARPSGPLPGLNQACPKTMFVKHWRSWAFAEHPFNAGPMCFWGRPGSGPFKAHRAFQACQTKTQQNIPPWFLLSWAHYFFCLACSVFHFV